MTFREYLGQDAQNPPATGLRYDHISQEDMQRLDTYIKNGQLSSQDVADINKMLSTGWIFNDALSRALEQSNQRKYLRTRQKDAIV